MSRLPRFSAPFSFAPGMTDDDHHLRSVRTKTLNNLQSARISVPPLLRDTSATSSTPDLPFVWRANLAATEPFWKGELEYQDRGTTLLTLLYVQAGSLGSPTSSSRAERPNFSCSPALRV